MVNISKNIKNITWKVLLEVTIKNICISSMHTHTCVYVYVSVYVDQSVIVCICINVCMYNIFQMN